MIGRYKVYKVIGLAFRRATSCFVIEVSLLNLIDEFKSYQEFVKLLSTREKFDSKNSKESLGITRERKR